MTQERTAKGAVVSVNVSEQKGTSKTPVSKIEMDEYGILGDSHAGDWHRQISLLAAESIERFGSAKACTFSWGDFAENITTRGIELASLSPFDRLTVGPVVLEVTQIGKKCHGGDCAIFQQVGECVMPREGIFCRVLHGGAIEAGAPVTVKRRALRCQVLTLSDRASAGLYPDLSGPRICEQLQAFCEHAKWKPEIECEILPDNAERLETVLTAARERQYHVVVTTGGTGIGPRDSTPDVVLRMADKTIPGIMEHIRLKYGANMPNALLSRSVAAVLGATLVYALPGSVKAVEEYMTEIVKTLEHAVYMINGLDVHEAPPL